MDILVHEKDGVIKYIKAPAEVKVEPPDLLKKNETCDNVEDKQRQGWSLLILRQKFTENYPSQKIEYLSLQTCYIASQGGK